MRAIACLAVALVGLSQPAWAVCIDRGGARTCVADPRKHQGIWADDSATAAANGATGVLQPVSPTGNAWVLTPQTTDGGTVLRSSADGGTALACEADCQ